MELKRRGPLRASGGTPATRSILSKLTVAVMLVLAVPVTVDAITGHGPADRSFVPHGDAVVPDEPVDVLDDTRSTQSRPPCRPNCA